MTELLNTIKAAIRANNDQVRTCIPARIIEIDYAQQKCSVQILIKRRDFNKQTEDIAPIVGVPIYQASADSGQFTNPIKVGDTGALIFSDRSIDRYMYSDGQATIDPADRRTHSLSDAIFWPGLYPYAKALGIDPRLTVMRHNAGLNNANNPGEHAIHLHPDGDAEAIVVGGNRHTDQLATIKINQDGSIKITSDEGNSLLSEIHMRSDGSIFINANNGTDVTMTQGGDIVVNSPSQVQVNSATADVNCSGLVTVDGSQIHLNGSGGGVLTQESINPITGTPYPDGSSTVKAGDG